MKNQILFYLCCCCFPFLTYGQQIDLAFNPTDSTQLHLIETQRGDLLFGRVLQLINTDLQFKFNQDIVFYQLNELKNIEVVPAGIDRVTYLENRHKTRKRLIDIPEGISSHRNFYTETAFPLGKKESELRDIEIIYASYDLGLSDNFSVGIGGFIPGLFTVRAKYARPIKDKLHWGVGTTFFMPTLEFDNNTSMVNYTNGMVTLGTFNHHFTFSVGHLVNFGEGQENIAVVTGAGSLRFASKWRFMFEMVAFPYSNFSNTTFLFSSTLGLQLGRNSIEFGVGGARQTNFGRFFGAIPLLSYAYRFSKK